MGNYSDVLYLFDVVAVLASAIVYANNMWNRQSH